MLDPIVGVIAALVAVFVGIGVKMVRIVIHNRKVAEYNSEQRENGVIE